LRARAIDRDTPRTRAIDRDTPRSRAIDRDTPRSRAIDRDTPRSRGTAFQLFVVRFFFRFLFLPVRRTVQTF